MTNNTLPIKWLKLNKFCELTGETEDAVQSRSTSGKWLDGRHVQVREGRLYVSIDAYNAWVENGLSKSEHAQSTELQARREKRKANATQKTALTAG